MELFRPGGNGGSNNSEGSSSTFNPLWSSFRDNNDSLDSVANDSNNSSSNRANATYDVQDPALPRGPPLTEQSIVPQLLVDHYVSMIDPSRAQTVDGEIARHCAFSLPAVALTLGRANWPLLRETCEALATDMQWKVRRTLASSIHELGVILGEEASGKDLIPIFNGFLKDLDEVRQGLLKHLADFMRLLSEEHSREYLPKLSEFLKMDNERNWRFRQELAEQLEKLIPLYTPAEVEEHISPIAMVLVHDKVAAVRESTTSVLAAIMSALSRSDTPALATSLLHLIVESLAQETLWVHRQTFAALALRLHETSAVSEAEFAEVIVPRLLDLSSDAVPNVRLAVARTLSSVNARTDFFRSEERNAHFERMVTVERNLKNDSDVDVRYLYGGEPKKMAGGGSGANSGLRDTDDEEDEFTDVGVRWKTMSLPFFTGF